MEAKRAGQIGIRFQSRSVALVTAALLLAAPVISILVMAIQPKGDVWAHLADTVLGEYLRNSLILATGVGVGTLLIGVSSAWLCSRCRFPGSRLLEWLLVLPLAMPSYIIAYAYSGMLDFSGPVQTALREAFAWQAGEYWFPDIRSLGGAVLLFSLVLYPYVYLLARAAFLAQSASVLEVGRSLGAGPWRAFFVLSLPLARPAIAAGIALAVMETLADFGAVQYFGIGTFTTGVYRTWTGFGDAAAAAQLSAVLLGFTFLALLVERASRARARFHPTSQRTQSAPKLRLSGMTGLGAALVCVLPFILGLLIPAIQLGVWTWTRGTQNLSGEFLGLARNSLALSALATIVTVAIALLLAYGMRERVSHAVRTVVRLAGMGYAVPGTIMAVGIILPLAWLDNSVDQFMRRHFELSTGLLLSGTLFALVFAYTVRFMAVALQSVEAGLARIRTSMDSAARSLGCNPGLTLVRVHAPMLRSSLLAALLLVFVDAMKELPATLILRPFDFNTLAVRTFELASDERLAEAGAPALLIVLTGILPIFFLNRTLARGA